jgi:diaminohydroxyphosphoribosylaminopyrimidine deaminase / 5-amino-6-(5-phosphoribosylamino)uracil reductase
MRIDIAAGSVYLAMVPRRDSMDKRPSIGPIGDPLYSARPCAEAKEDPPWWLAVLAARAAFAAQPEVSSVSVPLGSGSLHLTAQGGWHASAPVPDEIATQLDLYLPGCPPRSSGLLIAHIGQSLDGRIATENGESRWVTGPADLLHCHRMRALADAVIVGARTVRADDPQLTVRHCAGRNPVRVVIDPELTLSDRHFVFRDGAARTLVVAAQDHANGRRELHGSEILAVPRAGRRLEIRALRAALGRRGLSQVFIEGGGITISGFLEAECLDRLQITVAPIIIGSGPPGIALPGGRSLDRAFRPRIRRFNLGDDTLFDCDFDG